MQKASLVLLLAVLFTACNNKKDIPNVSDIKINLAVERFDEDFFSMDTTGIEKGIADLTNKYPVLFPIFLQSIIGVTNEEGVKSYYRLYKPIFDSTQKLYKKLWSCKS